MARSLPDSPNVGIIDTIYDKTAATIEVLDDVTAAIDLSTEVHTRVFRKIDWQLLPLVSLLYFLSFLDRANIGNARIAGMAKDLHLVGLRYNIASAIFFVTYSLGQVPSNVALKLFRPSRWIPLIMVAWGLVMTLMCLVKTYHQLLVARVFLGFAEAGLAPGVIYYLSSWYPRAERAKRFAVFISATSISGAFSGLLAYGIEKMDGIGGLHGWQWIFCLEGLGNPSIVRYSNRLTFISIATVLVALVAPFVMCDYPETASFLTDHERNYIIGLMKTDSQGLATHYSFRFVMQSLKDYRTYLQCGVLTGFVIPVSAIALFAPTIVNELGFSAANAQLLSVPPFVAGCITTFLFAIHSDRRRIRGPYVIAGAFVSLVGFVILYTQVRPGVALLGVVLATMGVYPPLPIIMAWITSNAGGDVKRTVTIAMVISLSNIGGVAGSFVFFDPPRFHVGLGISMGLLGFSTLMCLLSMWDYNRLNKQKERWCSEHGITNEHMYEFEEKGDDSPLFRYTL